MPALMSCPATTDIAWGPFGRRSRELMVDMRKALFYLNKLNNLLPYKRSKQAFRVIFLTSRLAICMSSVIVNYNTTSLERIGACGAGDQSNEKPSL